MAGEGPRPDDRIAAVARHLQAGGYFDPEALRASPGLARVGSVLDDRFQLRAELGRGGAGAVWRAFDRRTQREVALKLLLRREGTSPGRFVREGQLAAGLNHVGIVRVLEAGVLADERPYLVYELVDGARSLAAALPTLDWEARLRCLHQVVEAVAHAHARGVVHRDLKPENVILDASGRARVTDFGVSWGSDVTTLTATGVGVGTPDYMAPEQLLGDHGRRSPQVDVWSLGVLIYACAADVVPFVANDLPSLAAAVADGKHVPLHQAARHVPRWLSRVCERCLEPAPERRFPHAGALLAALRAPPPPSPWPRRVGALLLAAAAGGFASVSTKVLFDPVEDRPSSSDLGGPASASGDTPREAIAASADPVADPVADAVADAAIDAELDALLATARRALAGDPGAALRAAEQALALAPASAEALECRAVALVQLGRDPWPTVDALLEVAPAVGWRLTGELRRQERDWPAAADAFERAFALDPAQPALTRFMLADALTRSGRDVQGRAQFAAYLATERDDEQRLRTLVQRGELLAALGNAAESLDCFRRAHALRPSDVDIVVALATLQSMNHDDLAARETLERALREQPDDARLWSARSNMALEAGDLLTASAALDQAQRHQPGDGSLRLDRCYLELVRGDLEAARRQLDALADLDQPQLIPKRARCEALWSVLSGDPQRALSLLRPTATPAALDRYVRGEACRQLGRVEQAREQLRAYLEAAPRHHFAPAAREALRELEAPR